MSDFPEASNVFYIDDLFVDALPLTKPTKVGIFKMEIPTSDSIRFHFNVDYDNYEVLLATAPQTDLDNVSGEAHENSRVYGATLGYLQEYKNGFGLFVTARYLLTTSEALEAVFSTKIGLRYTF